MKRGGGAAIPSPTVPGSHIKMGAEAPHLWTAWLDYFATGEGRAVMACIAYAKSDEEIRAHFGKTFDPWYAKGCDVGQGVVRNHITLLVWSASMLDLIESSAGKGAAVQAHSWMHFNLYSL